MKRIIFMTSLLFLAVFVYLKESPPEVDHLDEQQKSSSAASSFNTVPNKQKKRPSRPSSPGPDKKDKSFNENGQASNSFDQKEYLEAKKSFQNFNLDTETLLQDWKQEKLQKYLVQASVDLSQCLEENLCGEQEPTDSPYFNPDYTDSHTHLEHNLGHLVFLNEIGELDLDVLTDDLLEKLLTIENEGIQQKAIELKLAKGINSHNYDDLLRLTEGLKSNAALSSLAVLSQYSQKDSQYRWPFIQTLKRVVEGHNQHRAVEVIKHVKNYNLDWDELSHLSEKAHCDKRPQNQKAIRHYLSIEAEGHGRELDLTCL